MDIVVHAFNGVFTIMLVIATGVYVERRGWVTEEIVGFISKLVNCVCLPPYMISSIITRFKHEQLLEMFSGLFVPFVTMMAGYAVARLLAKMLKVRKERRSIFTICVAFSNTIFIGLPLCVALFGDEAVPYIMLYYMVNTCLFWTIGVHDLASDNGDDVPLFSKRTVEKIFCAPLMGFATGVLMVVLDIGLPPTVFRAFQLVGSMTTPLAMLFIGIAISKTDWSHFKPDLEMFVSLAGRFVVCPLLVLAVLPFVDVNPLMARVFVIMSAMPAMTNISIVSRQYGGDYKYAALLSAVSTVMAVVTIPFYMWLIH